ncbi:myeloblastin-like [Protopterus annectens]|uniref:myeloblastin-like n=1 Tax=Protopterus annectens TaxID=7888 RepID=UPI001CF951B3|nr:myeloblastin-like [Protopterus annectens]
MKVFVILFMLAVFFSEKLGTFGAKVVGGHEVRPHSKPYMTSFQVYGRHLCGGFLISKKWVLTAAHCFSVHPVETITVVLGAHNIQRHERTTQRLKISKVIQHRFNPRTIRNDIVLVKLQRSARLNKFVKPITLPAQNRKVKPGTRCQVVGWGRLHNNLPLSATLQQVTVSVFSRCRRNMICTGTFGVRKGACKGDSGGPLVCNGVAYGITSFVIGGCANGMYPDFFTQISRYRNWIKKVTRV